MSVTHDTTTRHTVKITPYYTPFTTGPERGLFRAPITPDIHPLNRKCKSEPHRVQLPPGNPKKSTKKGGYKRKSCRVIRIWGILQQQQRSQCKPETDFQTPPPDPQPFAQNSLVFSHRCLNTDYPPGRFNRYPTPLPKRPLPPPERCRKMCSHSHVRNYPSPHLSSSLLCPVPSPCLPDWGESTPGAVVIGVPIAASVLINQA